MKLRSKKTQGKYPRVTLRVSVELVNRLTRIKRHTGLKPSQVIQSCMSNYLPVIEERHGMLEATK